MTQEERDLITQFIQRVGGQPAASGFGGSMPATTGQPPLPPVDKEADALIAELFARYPEARYRVSQMAFVQEHALMEAQNQINRLQWEMNNLRAAQQAAQAAPQASPWGQAAQQPQPQPQSSGGMFGGLFGGRSAPPPQQMQAPPMQPAYAPPPQPAYAPGYQPGMFQQQQGGGSGFLGSALTTAAGVAGGMVAGHALMNLFSGAHNPGYGGGFGTPMGSGSPTIVENFYGTPPGTGGQQGGVWSDPYAQGGAPKTDTGWTDAGGASSGGDWSNPTSGPGWSEPAPEPDTTWTDSGSDSGGWSDPDPT